MQNAQQGNLFAELPALEPPYHPRLAPLFRPHRIVLTKGSLSTTERRDFVARVCAVYPRAEVVERLEQGLQAFEVLEALDVLGRDRGLALTRHDGILVGRLSKWRESPPGKDAADFMPNEVVKQSLGVKSI